ncbi:Nuclear transcription factor Y subunit B-8 [Dictyocoela muelleri]|nr:Nuclear transcription factor Y subunit B-8 [Dictyocoela muelleri]
MKRWSKMNFRNINDNLNHDYDDINNNIKLTNNAYTFNNIHNNLNNIQESIKTTDRLLPIANISKIMKKPIPRTAKVAKDAKELMQKSASEFIAIVTCMAKDICASENRKTITGDDLIRSMKHLGMDHYAETTRKFFIKYKNMGKPMKIRDDDGYNDFDQQIF